MKEKKVFIVTARLGGDADLFYFVFNDQYYYDLFLECYKYIDRYDYKSIASLIEDCKAVDETFDWIADSEITEKSSSLEDLFNGAYTCISSLKELTEFVKDAIISKESEVCIS